MEAQDSIAIGGIGITFLVSCATLASFWPAPFTEPNRI
jgi:hypothetical protein